MRSRACLAFALLLLLAACAGWLPSRDVLELPVRNDSRQPITLEIVAADAPPGAPRQLGPPVNIPAGRLELVRINLPQEDWSLVVRGVEGYFDGVELQQWVADLASGRLEWFALSINAGGSPAVELRCANPGDASCP